MVSRTWTPDRTNPDARPVRCPSIDFATFFREALSGRADKTRASRKQAAEFKQKFLESCASLVSGPENSSGSGEAVLSAHKCRHATVIRQIAHTHTRPVLEHLGILEELEGHWTTGTTLLSDAGALRRDHLGNRHEGREGRDLNRVAAVRP